MTFSFQEEKASGILPIAPSTHAPSPPSRLSAGSGGHPQAVAREPGFPGSGEAQEDCGRFGVRWCKNEADHPGRIFVEGYRHSCMRPECPVCWRSWAWRAAQRIAHRIAEAKKRLKRYRKPVHVVISPPPEEWGSDETVLRRKAYKIAKEANFEGGTTIYHEKRKKRGSWYVSPHFHSIGFGWIRGSERVYERSGWVVKNLRLRESVLRTAWYQLTHATIRKGKMTVTWWGSCGYNQLKGVPPLEDEGSVCPLCGRGLLTPSLEYWPGELPDPPGPGRFVFEGGVFKPWVR